MPPPEELPPGGTPATDLDQRWEAWRPDEVARRLAAVTAPWYVAGGWALDLHRGEQTREHGDLEIGLPAPAFGEVRRALADCQLEVAGSGQLWPLDSPAFALMHQVWVSEPAADRPRGRIYRLDVFREPAASGQWVCRRDEQLALPYDRVIGRDRAGIPYLMPEITLLFKAKAARPKDEADFAATLPLLTAGQRDWLRQTLARVHPGHHWIGAL
jgi:hypothetical protein